MFLPWVSRETELLGNACAHVKKRDRVALILWRPASPILQSRLGDWELWWEGLLGLQSSLRQMSPEDHLTSVKSFNGLDEATHLIKK